MCAGSVLNHTLDQVVGRTASGWMKVESRAARERGVSARTEKTRVRRHDVSAPVGMLFV